MFADLQQSEVAARPLIKPLSANCCGDKSLMSGGITEMVFADV